MMCCGNMLGKLLLWPYFSPLKLGQHICHNGVDCEHMNTYHHYSNDRHQPLPKLSAPLPPFRTVIEPFPLRFSPFFSVFSVFRPSMIFPRKNPRPAAIR